MHLARTAETASLVPPSSSRPLKSPINNPSGPSKGYNESLELRLRETECVLFAVLAAVSESDTELSRLDFLDIPEGDVTPSAAEKKQRLEEWASFPLRSRDDVLRWRDERVSRDRHSQGAEESVDPSLEGSMEQSFPGDMEVDTGRIGSFEDGVGEAGMGTPRSLPPVDDIKAANYENYFPPVQESVHSSAPAVGPQRSDVGSGVLGLSKEFQDTFLW